MLFENTKQRLSTYHGYSPGTEKILAFDRYDDISAKDHERIRRAGDGSTDCSLTTNSPLPSREAILKNKYNRLGLSCILSTLDMDAYMSIDIRYNVGFKHDEADVTIITYLLQAAESGESVIRILTDDTDVFVLWYTGFGKCNCILQYRWNVGMGWSYISTRHVCYMVPSVCSCQECMPSTPATMYHAHSTRVRSVL